MREWWFVKLFKSWFIAIQLNQLLKKIALLLVSIVNVALHFSLVLGRYKHWSLSRKNSIAVAYRILLTQTPSLLSILHLVTTELFQRWISLLTQLT